MTSRLARLLLPLAAFAGCSSSGATNPTLEAARARWSQQPISHSFTLRRDCECLPDYVRPVRITVEAGQIKTAVFADDQSAVPAALRDSLPTIEGVFDRIEQAYDEHAARIEVDYDATRGFPTSVFVDYSVQVADEELSLTLSDFAAR